MDCVFLCRVIQHHSFQIKDPHDSKTHMWAFLYLMALVAQLTSFNLSISLCHALTLLRSTYTQCKHMKWQTWPYKPVMCLVKPPVYGGGIVSVCESSAFITLYIWSAPVHCSPPCLFITRVAQWKLITLKLWLTHPHCFVCLPISAHCSLICACQP